MTFSAGYIERSSCSLSGLSQILYVGDPGRANVSVVTILTPTATVSQRTLIVQSIQSKLAQGDRHPDVLPGTRVALACELGMTLVDWTADAFFSVDPLLQQEHSLTEHPPTPPPL